MYFWATFGARTCLWDVPFKGPRPWTPTHAATRLHQVPGSSYQLIPPDSDWWSRALGPAGHVMECLFVWLQAALYLEVLGPVEILRPISIESLRRCLCFDSCQFTLPPWGTECMCSCRARTHMPPFPSQISNMPLPFRWAGLVQKGGGG